MKHLRLVAVALLALLLAGCGAPRASVSGRTTADGAASATVQAAAATQAEESPDLPDALDWEEAAYLDEWISESSGLAWLDGHLLTVQDQGDPAVVYVLDPSTGERVGSITYTQSAPADVEAISTTADGTIWVADIGDNSEVRDEIRLWHIAPGDLEGETTVGGQGLVLTYPDGAHDAETLLIGPDGDLYVVTKDEAGGEVFAVDRAAGTLEATGLTAPATVTDGAFSPDGDTVWLRTYDAIHVYSWPDWQEIATYDDPGDPKGEGLAPGLAGQWWTTSEGTGTRVRRFDA